ncbi:hypothetical protein PMPD1_2466 [Paramixta manurensis]|uniref:Phage protein n=1 Tax=Paramixta manurensis TaxID=2740817 RepID=A0A6M8U9K2_9GAMM|nr:hypothetical protein PMPD1_2466 [Erwiniaceae bacterium PD-1]
MTTIAEVIGRVNTQLKDSAWLRWPISELCDYYNDAIRAVILSRPDAGATVETLDCVAGTKQTLPAGAVRVIEIIRVVEGRALLPVPRDVLDYQYPDWHAMTGTPERYVYNELTPRVFWLFPAPETAMQIEAVISRIPPVAKIKALKDASANNVIPIDELYINPIVDWMLYRSFSKDNEGGANVNIATQHYQAFADQLGIKQSADQFSQTLKQAQYTGGQQ